MPLDRLDVAEVSVRLPQKHRNTETLEGNPFDAVRKKCRVEVQNQADAKASVVQITEHLGDMNPCELIDRFHFADNAILDDKIESISRGEWLALVGKWYNELPAHG